MHTITYDMLIVYKRVFSINIIFTMQWYGYGDIHTSVRCKDASYYLHAKATRMPFVILHCLFDMSMYILFSFFTWYVSFMVWFSNVLVMTTLITKEVIGIHGGSIVLYSYCLTHLHLPYYLSMYMLFPVLIPSNPFNLVHIFLHWILQDYLRSSTYFLGMTRSIFHFWITCFFPILHSVCRLSTLH